MTERVKLDDFNAIASRAIASGVPAAATGGLLAAIAELLVRFVILSEAQVVAVALWVLHTHAFEAADATPYLSITSPEKRSGKTRLLEVLELVVAPPWLTGRTTAAALVRKIAKEEPTVLLDESDAAFGGDREYSETLRGTLNSGHRRGGRVSLCVGQGSAIDVHDLAVFSPKAIAGIGKPPDTVADRAIPIRLKRRSPSEHVERFRRRTVSDETAPIREALETWAASSIELLRVLRPKLPEELDDRAADGWEPLLAIADEAGASGRLVLGSPRSRS